jgi:type VI protein secretion system component VasK
VVPPGSERWVGEKNSAYIEALAKLGHSMQEISRNTGKSPDPAVHQAAAQDYDKAMDSAKQIERAFKPVGVQGLDMAVQRLLEEPIVHSNGFIIRDFGVAAAGKINGELRAVCARLKPTLHKYPFQPSRDDASLQDIAMWFAPGTGAIWKFEAQTLADFTVKDGTRWKVKDPAGKPQVTQEMLDFLNRAQAIADVFYPNGAGQPQLTYTLRPKLDSSYTDATLELEIDGKLHQWTSSLQKQFTWPAPTGAKDLGAVARIRVGAVTVPVASEGGEWGIFRIMGDAEPRPLSGRIVEWKNVRGGNGRLEPIRPAPVRVEIVEFPGGVDVFNPKFFEGFVCPAKAVQ